MPAVQPPALVLVTGASGFIAVHVVKAFIDAGYHVRGTVRSQDKGEYLKKEFPSNFDYVVVEDLEHEGGFDEAVKGVDAVAHTASPFHFNVTDPYKDLINPAVNGTNSILNSIAKSGTKVKRVVITSSFAAIVDLRKKRPHTFTENDWNEESLEALEKDGKNVNPRDAYKASKTLAEKAAWKFVEERKPSWDIVTMQPPLVLGPILHEVNSPEKLNTSVGGWYGWLAGKNDGDKAAGPQSNEVDVRDLAQAHVKSISVEEAGNNRFAISNQPYTWQLCLDAVYGDEAVSKDWPKLPKGQTGADKVDDQHYLDASKSKKILGISYTPLKQTLIDMSQSLAEREKAGWK